MIRSFVYSIIPAFLIAGGLLYAQGNRTDIKGTVTDAGGDLLSGVVVFLEGTQLGATSEDGFYSIKDVPAGKYQLVIYGIGYQKQTHPITIKADAGLVFNTVLQDDLLETENIVVEGKSLSEELKETGYSISIIESKQAKNFSRDVNQLLKTTPGIHIRETGGLGSGFKLSLNGLSGNQVRYFIDGIPMENFGSSLSLNNYPVNLIDKLEIYKGVVPVSLGADALGGAVNIVTDHRQKTFLDASYSYGSFNTHRTSLNGQYANNKHGFFLKTSSFFNHSENDYRMINVPVYDLELGNYLGTTNTRRFHDDYTSFMLQAEAGLVNKKFADSWSIGVTGAAARKNYQHPDNNIKRIFGHFHTKNRTLLFSSTYKKKFADIDLKAHLVTGAVRESVIDTGSAKYNWAGDFIRRSADDPKGELLERRSYLELSDRILRSSLNAEYTLNRHNKINLSANQNYLKRSGQDKVDPLNQSYRSPNYIHKNLLGLAYSYLNAAQNFEATLFGKQYWYSGKIVTHDYEDNRIVTEPRLMRSGYGLALSLHLFPNWQIKSSFEKAYRIPESFEILGDGIYVQANAALQPEQSHNLNLGSRFNTHASGLDVQTEVNLFARFSGDFIRFLPLGPFGQYENLSNVRTEGVEAFLGLNYNNLVSLNGNVTYQNITDRTKFDEGLPNANYTSRVPNIPYLFGNMRLGFSPWNSGANTWHFYWSLRYVHEFFLTWENLGNREDKNIIPSQLTHDLQAEYSIMEGRYNVSLTVSNVTDELVYDNFNIQKPGRSVNFKIRYFIK